LVKYNWSKVGHGSVNVAWSRLQIILSLERALAASAAAAAAAASGRALRATVTPLPAFSPQPENSSYGCCTAMN